MSFELPHIHVNEPFTWGPPVKEMEIDGMQANLYQKSDFIGTMDWIEQVETKEVHSFTTVKDETRLNALRNANAKDAARRRRRPDNKAVRHFDNMRGKNKKTMKTKRNLTFLPDTVKVPTDVRIIAEFTQLELAKLHNLQNTPTVVDISLHNRPPVYNNNMDRATSKAPIRLDEENISQQEFMRSNSVDDLTLREILKGEPATHPVVVTTDEVLALMMTCSRSVHPWHLQFFRHKRFLFISKADDSNVEMQWVGETEPDLEVRPTETEEQETERITSLGAESTRASNTFVAQACTKTRYEMKCDKNPFPKSHPRLYRYRRFEMHGDTEDRYSLVVRCEVDAVQNDQYVRMFGLLEHCSKGTSAWRGTLDTQAARWMSDEYRRNSQKMARWVALCHLSGALLKVGFLSRVRRANGTLDPTKHEVLAVHTKDHAPLAAQLGLKVTNMWAIADTIISAFLKQEEFMEGVLVKRSGEHSILLVENIENEEEDYEDDDEEDYDDEDEE